VSYTTQQTLPNDVKIWISAFGEDYTRSFVTHVNSTEFA